MEERGINTVQSTSAGRLFDAVSAILDIRKTSTFEGEASTSLQFAAEKWLDAQKKKIAGSENFAESGIITDYGELKSISDVAQKSVVEKNNSINRNIKADLYYLPTLSLVKEVAERKLAGENSNQLALHFHRRLAGMIVSACEKAREETGINTVALSGGVYQNKLLLDYSVTMLEERGFHVLRHHLLPPNDGGISLGQAVAAMRSLQKGE